MTAHAAASSKRVDDAWRVLHDVLDPEVPAISVTEPAATRRPLCITTTCEQVCSTSASRWLDTTTVPPAST